MSHKDDLDDDDDVVAAAAFICRAVLGRQLSLLTPMRSASKRGWCTGLNAELTTKCWWEKTTF